MKSTLLLEIFLAFSRLCHMAYLQVRRRLSCLFCFHQIIWLLTTSVMAAAVLLKKFCGEEGERVDVQKLFGYIGLFTLVALWWLGKLLLSNASVVTHQSQLMRLWAHYFPCAHLTVFFCSHTLPTKPFYFYPFYYIWHCFVGFKDGWWVSVFIISVIIYKSRMKNLNIVRLNWLLILFYTCSQYGLWWP